MCNPKEICIVLLIGLPGSGKTYFRTFFEDLFKNNFNSSLGRVGLQSISYDDYLCVHNPMELKYNSKWKVERNNILKNVEELVISIKQTDKNELEDCCSSRLKKSSKDYDKFVILIDDNMYYKSMRYDYFKLAKIHNTSFAQLHFKISLEEALKCNESRGRNKLPEEVISRMFSKLEPPDIKNVWELNSVTILSYANFKNTNVVKPILDCIKTALDNPITNKDDNLYKLKPQQITTSNALHQVDNLLKKLVGDCIKRKTKEKDTANRQIVAKSLSNRRLEILSKIKRGIITLPIDVMKPVDCNTIDCIKPYLLNLLDCLLRFYSNLPSIPSVQKLHNTLNISFKRCKMLKIQG